MTNRVREEQHQAQLEDKDRQRIEELKEEQKKGQERVEQKESIIR